jgi:hypothetical protein
MTYRFLKFTTIYAAVIDQILRRQPDYGKLSYSEIYEAVAGFNFAWSDYHIRHMRALGNEAENVFTNFEVLQKAWAREHGVQVSRDNWVHEIAIAQARQFQPDVIFIEDLYLFDADFRQQLRDACRGPVLMLGYRCAPTDDFRAFSDLDQLLTCVPHFADRLRQSGVPAAVMRHAFEPAIIDALAGMPERDLDFTFTGQLVLQNGFHEQRRAIIERLMERTPLQLWIQVSEPPTLTARVSAAVKRRTGLLLERIGARRFNETFESRIAPRETAYEAALKRNFCGRSHRAVFGLDNFRLLARSRLTFNNHIDVAADHAGNMRLFEATGVGACLVTDWKQDLHQIFEPDIEVVAYKSADECVEKVNYLLAHEKERQVIATAGQRRTLRDHTFAQRSTQLNELIGELFASREHLTASSSLPPNGR